MHDKLVQAIFWIFAFIAIVSALMVVTQNNPVRCVLFLVNTFFASAVLWLLAEAEFLALILVLVYVGAVMTLFLFVVMMLDITIESMKSHFVRYLPFGLILVALLTGLLLIAIPESIYKNKPVQTKVVEQQAISNTKQIGAVLYTDYVLAFELSAVLLLVAIIAAITLTQRDVSKSKKQNVARQIMTRAKDRLTLVAIKSEK